MRRRRRKPLLVATRPRPRFTLLGKRNHLVCYLWGGDIKPPGYSGIVGTLGHWKDERDGVLCERIHEQTKFGVHCTTPPYVASFEWSDKEGRNIPREFIKRFYSEARNDGYKSIHLVGFSGGGAVAASTLAHHSDKKDASMVKSLIVINSPIAERGGSGDPQRDKFSCVPHTDAAYYAKNIRTRTLLIYADQEVLKEGVAEWKKRNQVEDWYYQGEHDFGKTPQSFDSVTKKVIDFLKSSPDQEVRVAPLARRKRAKRKRVRKSQGTQTRQNIRKRGVLRLSHRKTG